jgi:hypothetical protein
MCDGITSQSSGPGFALLALRPLTAGVRRMSGRDRGARKIAKHEGRRIRPA